MITRCWNHKSICLSIFCVLVTGLITLGSGASLASSIMFQEASNTPSLESSIAVIRDVCLWPEPGYNQVTMLGPGGGGWIPAIAIAPDSSGTVYVACDVGGIYKSTNNGESWVINNKGITNTDTQIIMVDPQNPNVIYIATTGGIYKSTDGGENWLAKRNGFPEYEKWSFSAPISALAIDSANPDILYAGIGRAKGAGNSYEESHGQGIIYKSVDGGENWFIVNISPSAIDSSAVINSIAIDPSNTSTLYAGTNKGLYKSVDSGTSWTKKNDGLPIYSGETTTIIRKVIVNPHNPNILYVTVQTKPNTEPWQGGVYKSTDGGESWMAKCNGLANYAGWPDVHPMVTSNYWEMVIDPDNPEILYVGDFSWGSAGVYKTTDGGDNWVSTTTMTGPGKNMDIGWIDFVGLSVTSLAIDPSNPGRLYFGTGMTLFKTGSSGDSWSQAYTKEAGPRTGQSIGLETTCIWDIAMDKTNPDNIYVGYMDIGFLKTTDGGTSFKRTDRMSQYGGNALTVAIDPDSPNIIYAGFGWWETNSGWAVKSIDYGESWTIIGSPSNGLPDAQVWSIVIDPRTPVDSRTLYVASWDHGVYKSVDGGRSWVSKSSGIGTNLYVYSLVLDPNNPDILYAGIRATPGQSVGDYGGIYKTTDGGESWIKANKNIELPDVWALVMDPSDSNTLFVGTFQHYTQPSGPLHLGGVYKSIDGGKNWQALLTDDLPLSIFNIDALAISPVNPDLIFAGSVDYAYHDICTGAGIYRSTDKGQTWQAMNDGLTLLNINVLTPHPTNLDVVYAGTHGNSIFRIVMPRPATLSDLIISPAEVEIGDPVTVSVLVSNPGTIECAYQIQLMVSGSVLEADEVTLSGGESRTVTFTTSKNVAGVYSVTIGNLSGTFTVKVVPESVVAEEETPSLTPVTTQPSESPTTPHMVTPTPAKPTNWPVIGSLIGGAVVVVTLLVYFLVLRRRST